MGRESFKLINNTTRRYKRKLLFDLRWQFHTMNCKFVSGPAGKLATSIKQQCEVLRYALLALPNAVFTPHFRFVHLFFWWESLGIINSCYYSKECFSTCPEQRTAPKTSSTDASPQLNCGRRQPLHCTPIEQLCFGVCIYGRRKMNRSHTENLTDTAVLCIPARLISFDLCRLSKYGFPSLDQNKLFDLSSSPQKPLLDPL